MPIEAFKDDEEFHAFWAVLTSVARTAQLIPIEQAQKALNTISLSHALGPIIEPTMYRDMGLDNLEQQQILAEGFLAFRKAIDQVKGMADQ